VTGRLTLTWANKEKALVSDGQGGYRWVDPDDWRAREIRLLEPVSLVGDATGTPSDNLLIRGDGLDAMRSLARIPEYAEVYRGKVKLVYIDPPFNTGQAFEHYDDSLEHSVWLSMMRERLEVIRELLAPDGSVWVHLDDAEMAYCKVLMDEVFGRQNFIATIVWQKADSPRNSARHLSTDQDYILIYARDASLWRPVRLGRTAADDAKYANPDGDPRGPWLSGDLRANKPYSLGRYSVTGPTGRVFEPPHGRYWRVSHEAFRSLDADGRIWWGPKGDALPTLKRFLSGVGDLVPRTLWLGKDVGSNRTSNNEMRALFPSREAFATPKPERLLERVIHIGSNPGDIVLDAFAGSGTTVAVAHKMGRRWVTVEQQESTVDTFTRPRLERVVAGSDPGGVTPSVGWEGGGGFAELRVAPPVVDVIDRGQGTATVVDLEAEPGRLERSVAAQLGYRVDVNPAAPGAPRLIGTKGRSRLAVVRGIADEGLVASLVSQLADDELLFIAAPMIAPGAREALRAAVPGGRIIRYPTGFEAAGVAR